MHFFDRCFHGQRQPSQPGPVAELLPVGGKGGKMCGRSGPTLRPLFLPALVLDERVTTAHHAGQGRVQKVVVVAQRRTQNTPTPTRRATLLARPWRRSASFIIESASQRPSRQIFGRNTPARNFKISLCVVLCCGKFCIHFLFCFFQAISSRSTHTEYLVSCTNQPCWLPSGEKALAKCSIEKTISRPTMRGGGKEPQLSVVVAHDTAGAVGAGVGRVRGVGGGGV